MNELGIFVSDSRVVVSSRDVARVFERKHKNVIRDIENLHCSPEFRASNFEPVYKTMPNGAQITGRIEHYLIKRDGVMILIMGYTGKKAAELKIAYITTFSRMVEELSKPPASFADALLLAAKVQEEKEKRAAQL